VRKTAISLEAITVLELMCRGPVRGKNRSKRRRFRAEPFKTKGDEREKVRKEREKQVWFLCGKKNE